MDAETSPPKKKELWRIATDVAIKSLEGGFIIAVLFALFYVQPCPKKSKFSRAESDISQIEQALANYVSDHGEYPDDYASDHALYVDGKDYCNAAGEKKEWVRCLTERIEDAVTKEKFGPYLALGMPLDPWGHEYQYFRRLTGAPPSEVCTMQDTNLECSDGSFYDLYDYSDSTLSDEESSKAWNYVGCGQELADGENSREIWVPPPADRTTGADPATENLGLSSYYVFSLGQNGIPGGNSDKGYGDDIVSWDPERRWERTYGDRYPVSPFDIVWRAYWVWMGLSLAWITAVAAVLSVQSVSGYVRRWFGS